jgi:hypothetical protein
MSFKTYFEEKTFSGELLKTPDSLEKCPREVRTTDVYSEEVFEKTTCCVDLEQLLNPGINFPTKIH